MDVYDFVLPFGCILWGENRWIRLAKKINWSGLEKKYAAQFADSGKAAISFRTAFGALVIKRALNLSDPQLILLIQENPYMQYLLGFEEFTDKPPFSQSSLKLFRKRISKTAIAQAVRQLKEK